MKFTIMNLDKMDQQISNNDTEAPKADGITDKGHPVARCIRAA